MRLLGLSGKAGSGKDTVADFLCSDHGFTKVALADPMKRFCAEIYGFTHDQLWGPSASRNAPDKRYEHARVRSQGEPWQIEYLTPRFALQKLGTEWGRYCYENTWVDYGIGIAKVLLSAPHSASYSPARGLRTHLTHLIRNTHRIDGVVIPDIRFENEMQAIRAAGGKLVRIVRPAAGLAGSAGGHASETEQDSIPDDEFDIVIRNTGSLDDLAFLANALVHQLNGGEILTSAP